MTTQPDPAEGIRAHREAMAKNAALLRRNLANTGADGHPVATPSNPSRQGYMQVVMSGDTYRTGKLVDDLLDEIDRLKSTPTTKES